MQTTPIANLPYPELTDLPNAQTGFSNLANALDGILIPRYSNASARNLAITSPVAGMMSYLTSEARFERYTGSAWRPINHTEAGTLVVTFGVSAPTVTRAVVFGHTFVSAPVVSTNINSTAASTAQWCSRAYNITTTGCDLFLFSAVNVANTWSSIPVQWSATGV